MCFSACCCRKRRAVSLSETPTSLNSTNSDTLPFTHAHTTQHSLVAERRRSRASPSSHSNVPAAHFYIWIPQSLYNLFTTLLLTLPVLARAFFLFAVRALQAADAARSLLPHSSLCATAPPYPHSIIPFPSSVARVPAYRHSLTGLGACLPPAPLRFFGGGGERLRNTLGSPLPTLSANVPAICHHHQFSSLSISL